MVDEELTPEEEGVLDAEIAHASAILDGENAERDRRMEAEVFGPDPALQTFLGDAQPKPIEEWGSGLDPSETQAEWVARGRRAVFGDEGERERLDEHEDRLLMLENPDREPELLTDEQPWRWAILTADWVAGGNTVATNPCLEAGAVPDTGTTLTLYCTVPLDATPNFIGLSEGDVVAYIPFYNSANEAERGIIIGVSHAGTLADPAVILPAAFETEAAQTDAWDRASPPEGKDGVSIRHQTRTAYVHDGDEKLYAYYRTFTYDSSGKLATISAETRVEVDAPDDCPV